jgi:type VI protein secretion system component VasF
MKTVTDHLDKIVKDLQAMVTQLNRDGQHENALRAQTALIAVDDLIENGTWPDDAKWPPRVDIPPGGHSRDAVWRMAK